MNNRFGYFAQKIGMVVFLITLMVLISACDTFFKPFSTEEPDLGISASGVNADNIDSLVNQAAGSKKQSKQLVKILAEKLADLDIPLEERQAYSKAAVTAAVNSSGIMDSISSGIQSMIEGATSGDTGSAFNGLLSPLLQSTSDISEALTSLKGSNENYDNLDLSTTLESDDGVLSVLLLSMGGIIGAAGDKPPETISEMKDLSNDALNPESTGYQFAKKAVSDMKDKTLTEPLTVAGMDISEMVTDFDAIFNPPPPPPEGEIPEDEIPEEIPEE
ncbi:MAG: hypothetical protein LBM77_12405 [Spirochaetaceae bacterium]|jgi:hypothetical protein|nr:hypothetical protein [Spirochaetaceae bacterium]